MQRLTLICITLLGLFGLAACDTYEQDEYATEYVVEAYLVAGEPLPVVKVSRTAPIHATYRFDAFAVGDAEVTVHLLDEQGQVAAAYPYVLRTKGYYEPAGTAAVVQPLHRYALEVHVPGQAAPVRAETLVPGTFELLTASTDTLVYQGGEQLEARVTPSTYPGRQSIYVFTLNALDTTNYDLTPIYADMVEDGDMEKSDVVQNGSGIANEANFSTNPDGTLSLRLPWVALAFYGPNDIVANAIDDNLYDFIRSQGDGGTTSPGEIQNLIDHVEGGRGIFGSMASARLQVFVRPE